MLPPSSRINHGETRIQRIQVPIQVPILKPVYVEVPYPVYVPMPGPNRLNSMFQSMSPQLLQQIIEPQQETWVEEIEVDSEESSNDERIVTTVTKPLHRHRHRHRHHHPDTKTENKEITTDLQNTNTVNEEKKAQFLKIQDQQQSLTLSSQGKLDRSVYKKGKTQYSSQVLNTQTNLQKPPNLPQKSSANIPLDMSTSILQHTNRQIQDSLQLKKTNQFGNTLKVSNNNRQVHNPIDERSEMATSQEMSSVRKTKNYNN